jgi:Gpi18-like mannosyltransferase
MDINLTLWGWIVGVYFLSMISLSYYLGKKKTDMQVIATFIGGACSLIPPLGLIYLAALLFKKIKNPDVLRYYISYSESPSRLT